VSRRCSAAGASTGLVAGTVLLMTALGSCTSPTDTEPTAQGTSVTIPVVTATVTATVTVAPDPPPAAPDPAAPDPAHPDPAAPDPAHPDPAHPDPAAPDPAHPDPAHPDPAHPDPADPPPVALTVAAVRTPSATAVACRAVEDALADAVARYEVQALAEDGLAGGGDRTAAWTDMGKAMERAVREAGAAPGLAAAAAPVVAELAALRDGMAVRTDLDEEDAEPWRDARDRLEDWCDGHD
jgi:hypothetical protein